MCTVARKFWRVDGQRKGSAKPLELLEWYVDIKRLEGTRQSTLERCWRAKIDRHLIPMLGAIRIDSLKPELVLRALDGACQYMGSGKKGEPSQKTTTPLSGRSKEMLWGLLRSALRRALRDRRISRNPLDGARGPRVEKKRKTARWTEAQAEAFLESTVNDALHPLWTLLLTTGLRISEALGLHWSDLSGTALSVHQQLVDGERGPTKTDNSNRTLPLPTQALAALEAMRTRATAGVSWIFATSTGAPLSRRNVAREWERAVAESLQPRISLHGARHTFVTTALARGIAPNVVAAYAGHTPATMQAVYWDVLPSHGEAVASVMGAVFGGNR